MAFFGPSTIGAYGSSVHAATTTKHAKASEGFKFGFMGLLSFIAFDYGSDLVKNF
jgi:hypothetical protein